MKTFKSYLYKSYWQIFFPIFLTLFIITSIIFLVKIASLTSVIQLTFLELIELFIYNVPTILFYTLPVTIFIGIVLTLSKYSSEYELIVVTSFGLSPLKIIKLILPMILFASLLTILISLVLIPKANFLKEAFIAKKENQVQFNIKANEYGQEFGNWLIYVQKENNGLFEDIVLYSKKSADEKFITAKKATIENIDSYINLNLYEGRLFDLKDEKLLQVDFKKMVLFTHVKNKKVISSIDDYINYWKDEQDKLVFSILGSLFPLLSIFFVIVAGYYNPRYQKNKSALYALGITIVFIVISHKLSKELELQLLYFLPIVWFCIGYILYKYKIKPAY